MKIWIVTTVDPEAGGQCITPNVFATEAEAVAFLDGVMRQEWETYGLEDDEDEPRPYPGDWEKAQDQLAAHFTDGSFGQSMLTPHDVPDAAPAAPQTPDASALMLAALREAKDALQALAHHPAFQGEAPEFNKRGVGFNAIISTARAIRAAEGREG